MDSSRSISGVDPFVITAFGPPPTGINLNDETETRNNVITGVFLALAALSVLARWVARKIRDAHLGADDYAIFVSLVCSMLATLNTARRTNLSQVSMYCHRHRQHLL